MEPCAACTSCFDGTAEVIRRQREGVVLKHHISEQSLLAAAESGCFLCRQLQKSIAIKLKTASQDGPVGDFVVQAKLTSDYLDLCCVDSNNGILAYSISHIVLSVDGACRTDECSLPPSKCLDVSAVADLARSWIDQCLGHATCADTLPVTKSRPSRLIKILGPSGPASQIRLLDLASADDHKQYATLSYRWGGVNTLLLTRANFDELQRGIDATTLPLTFQHAFEMCLALSIRYIWIDSLCIMQDSPDDWLRESQQMGNIYRDALLSIAADAGHDSNAGLFPVQNDGLAPRLEHMLSKKTYDLFEGDRLYTIYPVLEAKTCLQEQLLHRRGWVHQESILSRRILHITHRGIIWECNAHFATSAYPEGTPRRVDLMNEQRDLAVIESNHGNTSNDTGHGHRMRAWNSMVERYTEMTLTVPDDRPVAMAGIIKEVERLWSTQCLAGLWVYCLKVQLLWSDRRYYGWNTEDERPNSRRIMPSFSWLSVDGEINMYSSAQEPTPLSTIISIYMKEPEMTPSGLVQHGRLRLSTKLRAVCLELRRNSKQGDRPTVRLDKGPLLLQMDYTRPGFVLPKPSPAEYWVVLITTEPPQQVSGLLLERTDPPAMATFRRIGMVYGSLNSEQMTDNVSLQAWLKSTDSEERIIDIV